jgi:hypothetical protein
MYSGDNIATILKCTVPAWEYFTTILQFPFLTSHNFTTLWQLIVHTFDFFVSCFSLSSTLVTVLQLSVYYYAYFYKYFAFPRSYLFLFYNYFVLLVHSCDSCAVFYHHPGRDHVQRNRPGVLLQSGTVYLTHMLSKKLSGTVAVDQ